MVADVREAQRPRVLDQHAEKPRPRGRSPIARCVFRVDPAVTKRSSSSAVVEDARRPRTARRSVAGDLEQLMEHRLDVELGDQAAPYVDQPPEAKLVKEARTSTALRLYGNRVRAEIADRRGTTENRWWTPPMAAPWPPHTVRACPPFAPPPRHGSPPPPSPAPCTAASSAALPSPASRPSPPRWRRTWSTRWSCSPRLRPRGRRQRPRRHPRRAVRRRRRHRGRDRP